MRDISFCEELCDLLPVLLAPALETARADQDGVCMVRWGRERPQHLGGGAGSPAGSDVCVGLSLSRLLEGPCSGQLLPVWG